MRVDRISNLLMTAKRLSDVLLFIHYHHFRVKKWLQDIPNQWDNLIDREGALMLDQQEQIADGRATHPDNVLMGKQSSFRRNFGELPSG